MAIAISSTPARRRAFFCGFAFFPIGAESACVASPSGANPAISPTVPDPAFAAADAYRAASIHLNSLEPGSNYDSPAWLKASKRQHHLWKSLAKTVPTSLPGLLAFAQHISSDPSLDDMRGSEGLTDALRSVTTALRRIVG